MENVLKTRTKLLTVTFHIIFWVAHFLTRLSFAQYFYTFDNNRLKMELIFLPIRVLATYFTIFFLVNKLLKKGKFFQFSLWLAVMLITAILLNRYAQFFIIRPLGLDTNLSDTNFWNFLRLLHSTIYIFPVVGIGAIVYLIINWYGEKKISYELTKEKLEAELKFLKAQIHPHFLFNTINNIYSLALDKSDKTAGSLLKLSDLMSYMIYESEAKEVQLMKEVEILKDYIELEKIRYGPKLDFQFTLKGELKNKQIAPLLFLPIAENCFKHGAGESIEKSYIRLNLECSNNEIVFSAVNSKAFSESNNEKGIGLSNLEKRLKLIYNDNYVLHVEDGDREFKVVLKINIHK